MATYLVLGNYTEQGIKNIKDSPKRLDAARDLAKSMGAEFKEFYLTLGAYDFVTVVEAPSDAIAARFALAAASRGAVRTTTLKAFPEKEYRDIISKLP